MKITFPKLYRYDRKREHAYVAVPFPQGALWDGERVQLWVISNNHGRRQERKPSVVSAPFPPLPVRSHLAKAVSNER